MSDDRPHWRVRRGRLLIREQHTRDVPPEIITRIEALEDMARAWVDAHAVILRHVDELRRQNEMLRHAVNVLNEAPPYHTHDNHQLFEGFADIGGQHYPVTIRMRSAA